MYDEFIQLVEHKAWDVAFEFISLQQTNFKSGLSNQTRKDQEKIAKTLKTLYEHLESDISQEIFKYEFANFIQIHTSKFQFTELFFQQTEPKDCLVCMESLEYNEPVIFCKICSECMGHSKCFQLWFSASKKCLKC
jgi:hypothetical protein